jgi:hypothetical protein
VLRVHLDRVDGAARPGRRHRGRGVAERGTDLDDAVGAHGGGERRRHPGVAVGVGAAAVRSAVLPGGLLDVGHGVDQVRRAGHGAEEAPSGDAGPSAELHPAAHGRRPDERAATATGGPTVITVEDTVRSLLGKGTGGDHDVT